MCVAREQQKKQTFGFLIENRMLTADSKGANIKEYQITQKELSINDN